MNKQINPLIRAPDIHKAVTGKHRNRYMLYVLSKSEVQHGTIMNSMVLLLHTSQVKPVLDYAGSDGSFTGKTYKFDFRFHFHHYLFIMRSSTLATTTRATATTRRSNDIALHS